PRAGRGGRPMVLARWRLGGRGTPREAKSLFKYAFSANPRDGLRSRCSSASIRRASSAPDGLVELGEDLLTEDLDPFELVTAHVVEVDAVEAKINELLDFAAMGVRIGRDQHPPLKVLRPDQLRHLLEITRRPDIRLRKLHATIRPFGQGVLHRLLIGGGPGKM